MSADDRERLDALQRALDALRGQLGPRDATPPAPPVSKGPEGPGEPVDPNLASKAAVDRLRALRWDRSTPPTSPAEVPTTISKGPEAPGEPVDPRLSSKAAAAMNRLRALKAPPMPDLLLPLREELLSFARRQLAAGDGPSAAIALEALLGSLPPGHPQREEVAALAARARGSRADGPERATAQVSDVVRGSGTRVSLDDLERKGFRSVKVLRAGDINQLILKAVRTVLAKEGRALDEVEQAKLVAEAHGELERGLAARRRAGADEGDAQDLAVERVVDPALSAGYLLMAAQDGELTPEETAALEDRLGAADPVLRVEWAWLERARAALGRVAAFVPADDDVVWDRLRAGVRVRLDQEAGRTALRSAARDQVRRNAGPAGVGAFELTSEQAAAIFGAKAKVHDEGRELEQAQRNLEAKLEQVNRQFAAEKQAFLREKAAFREEQAIVARAGARQPAPPRARPEGSGAPVATDARTEELGHPDFDLPRRLGQIAEAMSDRPEACRRYVVYAERCVQAGYPDVARLTLERVLGLDPSFAPARERLAALDSPTESDRFGAAPVSVLRSGTLEVASVHVTAAGEPSGDLVDVAERACGIDVLIGDVSGRGAASVAAAAATRAAVHVALALGAEPSAALSATNRALKRTLAPAMFVAASLVRWDEARGRAVIAGAGHEDVIVYRADGRVERVKPGGVVLGVVEDPPAFAPREVELRPGDALVLVSDGVPEASTPGGELLCDSGWDRLLGLVAARGHLDPAGLVGAVRDAVQAWVGARAPEDDVVVVALRRTPTAQLPTTKAAHVASLLGLDAFFGP